MATIRLTYDITFNSDDDKKLEEIKEYIEENSADLIKHITYIYDISGIATDVVSSCIDEDDWEEDNWE